MSGHTRSFEIQPQRYLKQVARSQHRRGIGVSFIPFFVLSHTAKGSWHRSYLARGGGLTASLAGFPTCKHKFNGDGDFHRRYPILLHRFQFKRSRYTCPLRAPSISDQSYQYINVDITWAASSTQLYSHHDSSMMDHNLADHQVLRIGIGDEGMKAFAEAVGRSRQLSGDPKALRLFIRRIPDVAKNSDLQVHFGQYGQCLDAAVLQGACS